MKIINKTPHTIKIMVRGLISEFPPAGEPARIEMKETFVNTIEGIDVFLTSIEKSTNLPVERNGVMYIVSRQVIEACPHRRNLLIPHGAIRDTEGNIQAYKGFAITVNK